MRYDDASQAVSNGHSEPIARPDVDTLPAGSFGPATGNAISGEGTSSGASGADKVGAAPATITEVQGAGGPAIVANGTFQANGQYGVLSMDAQGNFNYVRNANTPDGVKDVFNYTIADAAGASASTTLTIDIGQVAAAANGQGVVALPAGVELSDIHVNGRDLVINMPDGTQMVIPNGAVFVPEITIGDVQVPASNVAALLVESEPQPAAGQLGEPGGNWNDPIPTLDPTVPLGDLIPPTDFGYKPPEFQEPDNAVHQHPTVVIETPDFPLGVVDASESVFEKGLPGRDGNLPNEPAGSGEIADGNPSNNSDPSETNTGTIVFTAQGGVQSITIDGVAITQVGQTIQGQFGTMTITGIDLANGQITYSYTLADNTSGDNTADHFSVVVTDNSGDTATATLTVNIVDDVPTARNDTDSADLVTHVATGNVMTGADTTSGSAGADTVGADNATLTGISSNATGQSDATFDASGNLVVEGEFGTLVIKADGTYTYTLHADAPGGSTDVFTYTLTDGDGDTSQATLTITNPDHAPTVGENLVVQLDDDALPGGNPGGPGDDPNGVNTTGTLSGSGGDGALTFALTTNGAPAGFTYSLQANGDLWVMQGSTHVLTITVDSATGVYDVTQVAPIMHPPGDAENNVVFDISYTVTDSDGDSVTGHLTVNVDDDTPIATNDADSVDLQTGIATGNVVTGVGTTSSGPDSAGADGGGHITGLSSNNESGHVDNDPSGGGFVVVGEFGTLTMQADGSYSYQLNQNAPGGSVDVFTYSYTDADGDTTTATLTITNPDHQPTTGPNALVIVDDDDVSGANGNPGGVGDENPQNTSGTLSGSGGDGSLTFALTASGAPSGFTYQLQANGDLWVLQGQTHVLTITVDASSGKYTVTEVAPIMHPPGGDENNVDFTITYTVTDSDGDHANGTLTIQVNDDTPIANNDTDSVAQGATTADGNVITGAGTDNPSAGADHFGADGSGGLIGISSNFTSESDTTFDASGNLVVHGEFGTLTIKADGSYTYQLDQGTHGDGNDVFTYTIVDGDGDTTTATLTIAVPPQNGAPTAEDSSVNVSEEGLANGIPDSNGSPDTTDSPTASGTINASDPDGDPMTITLGVPSGTFTSGGQTVNWSVSPDGLTLTGYTGNDPSANHVVVVTMHADGTYDVQLIQPFDDPNPNAEDSIAFVVPVTVADNHGGSTDVSITVTVEDDSPTLNEGNVSLGTVYEDGLAGGNAEGGPQPTSLTFNGTDLSSLVNSGADTPLTFSFNTGIDGTSTGMTENGVSIVWNVIDATHVEGVLSNDPNHAVFTVTDNGDGTFTFTLLDNIDNNPSGAGDSDVDALSLNGLFVATDADGDHVTLTSGVSLDIQNDVPTLNNGTLDVGIVYEDGLAGGNQENVSQVTTATINASALAGLVNAGADGPVTISFNGAIDGTSTGLTENGVSIVWNVIDATHVEGVLSNDPSHQVFTVTDNGDGTFTFTLLDNIDNNPSGAGDSDVDSLSLDGLFKATDTDGDSVVLSSGVSIDIQNDVPTLNSNTYSVGTVYEDSLPGGNPDGGSQPTTATILGSSLASLVNPGADGPVTFTLNPGIDGTATGLTQDGISIDWHYVSATEVEGVVHGTNDVVFTITSAGGGDYTFTLLEHIDNTPTGAGDSDVDTLSLGNVFVATDSDGDSVTLGSGVSIDIQNDVPTGTEGGLKVGTVYEDGLAGGNQENVNQVTTATINASDLAALVAAGADAPVTIGFNAAIDGSSTGMTENGVSIVWNVIDANHIEGVLSNDPSHQVFTITNNGNGTFTFTLLDNVDNNPSGAGDSDVDTLSLDGVFTATDTDGDKTVINSGVSIDIQNDVPTLKAGTYDVGTVYEDGLTGGNQENVNQVTTATINASSLAALVNAGADGPVAITFNGAIDGSSTGLTENGISIVWNVIDATHVEGVLANDPNHQVFTVTDNGNGTFTFTLLDNIDNNPSGAGDSDVDSLSLNGLFKATDTDGDSVVLSSGVSIDIQNDVPTLKAGTYDVGTVYEDGLPGGNQENVSQVTTATINASSLAALVNPGADSPVSISFNAGIDGTATGMTENGTSIVWNVIDATHVEGVLANDPNHEVFTVTDNGDGTFTFTLLDHIDNNPSGAGDSDVDSLSLDGLFKATDTDGDSVVISAGVSIDIQNDIPVTFVPASAELENDTGSVTGVSLDTGDGNVNNNVGADTPGVVRFPSSLEGTDSGLTSALQPILWHVSADGQTLIGYVESGADSGFQSNEDSTIITLTIDQATSSYSVEMSGHVDAFTHIDFNGGNYNFVGGNDPWGGFNTAANDDSQDLLITPMINGVDDGTFNSSSISGGVGSGNSVDLNEGLRLDYVVDLGGNPAKSGTGGYSNPANQDQTFDGHYTTNGASADFTATTGSTVHIEAFDDPDGNNVVGDGVHDNITSIAISYGGGPAMLITASGTYIVDGQTYTVTFNANGTVDVAGVVGTSGAGAVPTTIAVFTDDGYNSLQFTNIGGDTFKIGNFGAFVQSTDPIPVSVPTEIVDSDGDVVAGGNINVQIDPPGQQNNAVNNNSATTQSTSSTSDKSHGASNHSLVSSNDNGGEGHRAYAIAQNVTMMAALAVAGLEAQENRLDLHALSHAPNHEPTMVPLEASMRAPAAAEASAIVAPTHVIQPVVAAHAVQGPVANGHHHDTAYEAHGAVSGDARQAPMMTELLHGSAPAHSAAANAAAVTAHAVTVPSAQALAAAQAHGPGQAQPAAPVDNAQHDQVVSKVVADALNGGDGHGPNVDHLLNSLPGHDAAHTALEALAAQGLALAFHGAMPTGYGAPHALLSVEMVMQQHAAPPAHG